MAPAASRDTYRSTEHEDVHDAAIGIVGLVPLVESGAHQHACSTLSGRSGRCEFARKAYHVFSTHTGYVLLPTGRERNVVHLTLRNLTADAAVDT